MPYRVRIEAGGPTRYYSGDRSSMAVETPEHAQRFRDYKNALWEAQRLNQLASDWGIGIPSPAFVERFK